MIRMKGWTSEGIGLGVGLEVGFGSADIFRTMFIMIGMMVVKYCRAFVSYLQHIIVIILNLILLDFNFGKDHRKASKSMSNLVCYQSRER